MAARRMRSGGGPLAGLPGAARVAPGWQRVPPVCLRALHQVLLRCIHSLYLACTAAAKVSFTIIGRQFLTAAALVAAPLTQGVQEVLLVFVLCLAAVEVKV